MDDNFGDLDNLGHFARRGGYLPLNSPGKLGGGEVFGEEVISRPNPLHYEHQTPNPETLRPTSQKPYTPNQGLFTHATPARDAGGLWSGGAGDARHSPKVVLQCETLKPETRNCHPSRSAPEP